MFDWLKTLLRKPLDLPDLDALNVPIRYVNVTDVSFGLNLPGYFRICMNLETGEITKKHIKGAYTTDEITDLDCQIAYDKLPDEYKPKYRAYLEKLNVKISY